MKSIFRYIAQNLTLILLLAGVAVFTSCEDENATSSGIVELKSFGPVGVRHGEMIQFVGVNFEQVTAIVFANGTTVNSSQFATKSSSKIEIVVPDDAEAGLVTLKTPKGDVVSKTIISFDVPVVINSITAEAKPGTSITITGEFLNWVESVTFTSDLLVEKDDFVSHSQTQLVITVPMEAQSGLLIFSSGGTEPMLFSSMEELIVTLPAVTEFDPQALRHTSNLTITGTDLDLVTSIVFPGDFEVFDFESQSVTEIVVAVPVGTTDGSLTLHVHSPLQVTTTQTISIILPAGTGISPTPAIPGVDNVTIVGTDLDLVGELKLPGIDNPVASSSFVSQSATQIVLAVPEGAASGGISYNTIHGYSNNLGVLLIVPGEGPPPLAINMFDEAIEYGGGNWSWDGTSDIASTEQFYSGNVSWKFVTTNGGGASVGGMSGINASSLGSFVFSLYGGIGTDGAQVAVILNDNWGNYNSVTLVEGQWTEYRLDFGLYPGIDFSNITRWIFKVEGITSSTIYIDRVGFDPAGPPPLSITMYDETVGFAGGDWSWNVGTSDNASTEQAYSGDVSWKFVTPSDGGVSMGGMTGVDASLKSFYVFSLYGGPGTDGAQVACILGSDDSDKWDSYNAVTLEEGKWTEYKIDLADYSTVNLENVTRWIFKVEGMTGSTIYVDRVGFD